MTADRRRRPGGAGRRQRRAIVLACSFAAAGLALMALGAPASAEQSALVGTKGTPDPLGLPAALAIFGGIPIGIFLFVAAWVYFPSLLAGAKRRRPGREPAAVRATPVAEGAPPGGSSATDANDVEPPAAAGPGPRR